MRWYDIHARRTTAMTVIRAVSAVLIVAGTYLVLKKALFAVGTLQAAMFLDVYTEIGQTHDTYRGLSMLAVGLTLAFLNVRVARWIVPAPPTGCPGCGYATPPDIKSCPECGLTDRDASV